MKYLITEAMKQDLESLLEHHPTQLMELRMLEPDTTIERLEADVTHWKRRYEAESALRPHWAQGFTDDSVAAQLLTTTPPPKEQVRWGIDWGKQGDRTAVSIVKQHPDGTLEVVAMEAEPDPTFQDTPPAPVKPVEVYPFSNAGLA
jgi:hypothetical protein